jgi:hypothetical protein
MRSSLSSSPEVRRLCAAALAVMACGVDVGGASGLSAGVDEATGVATGSAAEAGSTAGGATEGDATETEGFKFDVAGGATESGGEGGGRPPSCRVSDDGVDAVPPCSEKAPPDSFDPEVQWSWDGFEGESDVVATPLVANLTDDNGDGAIDLCDVPDVVVLAYTHTPCFCCATDPPQDCVWNPGAWAEYGTGHVYVLDGATGSMHARFELPVDATADPALGDIDGDGVPEILAYRFDGVNGNNLADYRRLVAFDHDGTVKWEAGAKISSWDPIALADLDNDGSVEILAQGSVWNADGEPVLIGGENNEGQGNPDPFLGSWIQTAADLDGDLDLELVAGCDAYHHDGTAYFDRCLVPIWDPDGDLLRGAPVVADVDDDGLPEVVVFANEGDGDFYVLEHDGTVKFEYGSGFDFTPAAIHDIDGDGAPEVMSRAQKKFMVHDFLPGGVAPAWSAPVEDLTGLAGGTAFDFLGDGSAEAIYADETQLWVFGPHAAVEIAWPRGSWTAFEFPVVADVDNDGSAEIVVVSNGGYNFEGPHGGKIAPAVQVIRDAEDRWVGARRIWNQNTYHVTNVREDGTIPQFEPPHWKQLNTFRTQAQLEGGGVCQPEPEG